MACLQPTKLEWGALEWGALERKGVTKNQGKALHN
jgi:hypothetical protein